MGIRKHPGTPKIPRRSMRQKQRQLSNLESPSACRMPRSSTTPTKTYKNHLLVLDTVTRAKIQGAREFALTKNISYNPKNIFAQFGVKNRTRYRFIEIGTPARTRQQDVKKRDRKNKLSRANVATVDSLLEETEIGLEVKEMTWQAIVWELDLDVYPQTLERTLRDALDYGKHDVAIKENLFERIKRDRVDWASAMLTKRHTIELWKNVRFSDEFHAGFELEGQLKIIRKRGNDMRDRFDNI